MKKRLLALLTLSVFLLTAIASPAMAVQQVKVTLPTFKVTINGGEVDSKYSKYPLLVYKDITYVPMTYYHAQFLGLKTNWANNTLTIESGPTYAEYENWYDTKTPNRNNYNATVATSNIIVNDKNIQNSKEKYPLLLFRDVTYFPLTWRFAADEFGWKYDFDSKNGLQIYSRGNISAHRWSKTQYITSGDIKIGYPPNTFNESYTFTYQKASEQEKSFSLKSQLMDGNYFFDVQRDENGYSNPDSNVKPFIKGNILSMPCVRMQEGEKENFILKIDFIQEKIISKEVAPLLPVKK